MSYKKYQQTNYFFANILKDFMLFILKLENIIKGTNL
jgi:hypothetical protein